MDTISTSQALQIAGRAGRFSSVFKEGEVTTMQRDDLPVLKEILGKPIEPIEVRIVLKFSVRVSCLFCFYFWYFKYDGEFVSWSLYLFKSKIAGLHPTAEQIEMFAYHLPQATLSNLIVGAHIKIYICNCVFKTVNLCGHFEPLFRIYLWVFHKWMDITLCATLMTLNSWRIWSSTFLWICALAMCSALRPSTRNSLLCAHPSSRWETETFWTI